MSTVQTHLIIQARMASTRLPGKTLLPLPEPNGSTVLDHIISRCKAVPEASKIVVATTVSASDDRLVEWLQLNHPETGIFRGSEANVLDRYLKAGEENGASHIVRVTADNPCIDPSMISGCIRYHLEQQADYTQTTGCPLGTNLEVFSLKALKTAEAEELTSAEQEHVTLHFRQHPEKYKLALIESSRHSWGHWRLTIDTPSDYIQLCAIMDALYAGNPLFGLDELIELESQKPWLFRINAGDFQKRPELSETEELNYARSVLTRLELFRAAGKL